MWSLVNTSDHIYLLLCLSLSVFLLARLLKNVCIWMKFCMWTDVGTWTKWLTFEPDPDHSPDAGTGFLSRISYTLCNFAALPSLAYFSAISVSICVKLARSIIMMYRNTTAEPDFRKMLSKCRILSPKNSYLSTWNVNQQQHCSSAASLDRSITSARYIFSLYVYQIWSC